MAWHGLSFLEHLDCGLGVFNRALGFARPLLGLYCGLCSGLQRQLPAQEVGHSFAIAGPGSWICGIAALQVNLPRLSQGRTVLCWASLCCFAVSTAGRLGCRALVKWLTQLLMLFLLPEAAAAAGRGLLCG